METITITIFNLKGGVGKTTTAINLAYEYAKTKKVLLVDLDPQKNLTSFFQKKEERKSLVDFLNNKSWKSCIYTSRYQNIDLICGSPYLQEGLLPDTLYKSLEKIKNDYDIILIDCLPSCGSIAVNGLYAADMIISPILLDRFSTENLQTVRRILEHIPDVSWSIFVNRFKNRIGQRKIYTKMTENDYPFLQTAISDRVSVPNSLEQRKPLEKHRSNDIVAKEFATLASEIMEVV